LQQLAARLPVTAENIQQGLQSVTLMGRMQRVHEQPEVLLDVAHNPHAAKELAAWLKKNPRNGKTFAIFSILADKDIAGVVEIMSAELDEWHVVALSGSRALSCEVLADKIKASGVQVPIYTYSDFRSAWNSVHLSAEKQARVVAFGSFLVVSGMLEILVP
jgi:dihydrofolate synthase/folylpolyglutamate synthase